MASVSEGEPALLGWTSKQGRILSGGGVAEKCYVDYAPAQLPHHHLTSGTTHEAFAAWRRGRSFDGSDGDAGFPTPACGVWNRPLFLGGWEHSSDATELVYNTQTPTLFIDLRIPRARPPFVARGHRSLATLSDLELRCFARQHCFSGYSLLGGTAAAPDVTRHHVIDWNFVGKPRSRPNRWRVEMAPPSVPSPLVPASSSSPSSSSAASPLPAPPPTAAPGERQPPWRNGNVWKEWSYATDAFGQHYYMERWERRPGDEGGEGTVLALRKSAPRDADRSPEPRDAVLLVVGRHFAFARGRHLGPLAAWSAATAASSISAASAPYDDEAAGLGSLVAVVDAALARGDRKRAEMFLSLEGGHGMLVSGGGGGGGTAGAGAGAEAEAAGKNQSGGGGRGEEEAAAGARQAGAWIVDAATHPWQEGEPCREMLGGGGGRGARVIGGAWAASSSSSSSSSPPPPSSSSSFSAPFLGAVVELGGERWDVLECSFRSPAALEAFLRGCQQASADAAAVAAARSTSSSSSSSFSRL